MQVYFSEKFQVGEFHMIGVGVTFEQNDIDLIAQEAGIEVESVVDLRNCISQVMYEGRIATALSAVKAGVLTPEQVQSVVLPWKPKVS